MLSAEQRNAIRSAIDHARRVDVVTTDHRPFLGITVEPKRWGTCQRKTFDVGAIAYRCGEPAAPGERFCRRHGGKRPKPSKA